MRSMNGIAAPSGKVSKPAGTSACQAPPAHTSRLKPGPVTAVGVGGGAGGDVGVGGGCAVAVAVAVGAGGAVTLSELPSQTPTRIAPKEANSRATPASGSSGGDEGGWRNPAGGGGHCP